MTCIAVIYLNQQRETVLLPQQDVAHLAGAAGARARLFAAACTRRRCTKTTRRGWDHDDGLLDDEHGDRQS